MISVIDTIEALLLFLMTIETKSHIFLNLNLIKIPHTLGLLRYQLFLLEIFIFNVLLLTDTNLLRILFNHLILLAESL